MSFWWAKVAVLAVALTLLGQSAVRADERLTAVATFSIVGDLTQKIGGDAITLTTLVGPNEDAHAFEPTAEAQRALAAAQVLGNHWISLRQNSTAIRL